MSDQHNESTKKEANMKLVTTIILAAAVTLATLTLFTQLGHIPTMSDVRASITPKKQKHVTTTVKRIKLGNKEFKWTTRRTRYI